MENNSNAIAEIQKKYAGCNLLMPAATEVQLNPFYKITVMEVTADLSENSGDIFKVGSVKTGTTQQGKDIWEETYSPAKPLLMKIAAAAGIQFDPDHTYGTKIDANTYKAKGASLRSVKQKNMNVLSWISRMLLATYCSPRLLPIISRIWNTASNLPQWRISGLS